MLLSLFLLLDRLYPLDSKKLYRAESTRIYDDKHRLLRILPSQDGFYRFRTTPQELPALLKKSVLHFEDRYFYTHPGFNPVAIIKAFAHNLFSSRKIGASTITMQVARMMHRRPRTFSNKLKELFTALQLEWHYSKDQILNFYLNLAPYGGTIEGIKTAAWFYYHKSPQELSIAEIAMLTTIPKNPNLNRLDRAKNLYQKRLRVLRQLLRAKLIDRDQFKRAFKEPILAKRYKAPFKAPHFTGQFTQSGDINSSLDLALHTELLRTLYHHTQALQSLGVHNAAAIIIDNKRMQIKAYVGSERFFDSKHFGQNNGVKMIRSPGSTLKPFIYAKAFDHGLITPNRLLYDLPLFKNGYDPQNFSRRFSGVVTATQALQASLNIPAVTLNQLLGDDALYELLKKAQIATVNEEKSYYGDAIALGGFGISLLDLAHLYTAFSHGGTLYTLGSTADHKPKKITRLFSKASAYLVDTILSDAQRMEFSAYWESTQDPQIIAFKTGTSAQNRDLYTVGVTPNYTIAVWMGDFQGNPTQDLTGIATASRVLFDVLKLLPKAPEWFEKPDTVQNKKICCDAILFGECRNLLSDQCIVDLPQERPCELLRPEVLAYLKSNRIVSKDAFLAHDCFAVWNRKSPMIAPFYDKQIIKKSNNASSNMLNNVLKCYTYKQNPKVTWLIDDAPPHAALSAQSYLVKLAKGRHQISCIDNSADISTINITIK